MKLCCKCKIVKPNADFYTNKSAKLHVPINLQVITAKQNYTKSNKLEV